MSLIKMVGNTPMVSVDGVYLKLEYYNPTGSHKDRTALYMVRDAERKGLKKGQFVVEYTSGNTGISVAWVSKILGYKAVILVPEGTSEEKVNLIRAFGAEIIYVTPEEEGHILAERIAMERGGVYLHQTQNMANFKAHYETTGPEILKQVKIADCFVMGAGTGGTVYGVGKYLKEKKNMRVIALLPKGSYAQEMLTGKKEEDREILEGFSYHSFSELLHKAMEEGVIDEIRYVSSEESIEGMKKLLSRGIYGGPTSGANFYHALKLKEDGYRPLTIVADSIIRYPKILEEVAKK